MNYSRNPVVLLYNRLYFNKSSGVLYDSISGNTDQIGQGDIVQSTGALYHRYGLEKWTFIVLLVFILSILSIHVGLGF